MSPEFHVDPVSNIVTDLYLSASSSFSDVCLTTWFIISNKIKQCFTHIQSAERWRQSSGSQAAARSLFETRQSIITSPHQEAVSAYIWMTRMRRSAAFRCSSYARFFPLSNYRFHNTSLKTVKPFTLKWVKSANKTHHAHHFRSE